MHDCIGGARHFANYLPTVPWIIQKCYFWNVSFYYILLLPSKIYIWALVIGHLCFWILGIQVISTFNNQQMLKPSCQGYKGSEKWFPWSPGADLLNTKHCFGPYVRNKISSSGTFSPTQFKRCLKGPSDSLVNADLHETKSMKSIPAALFSWMKMGFELQPFSDKKLEG